MARRVRQYAQGWATERRYLEVSKHRTERCKQIAWRHGILLSEVGSTLHGVSDGSTGDDLDLMGICFEPPQTAIGLEKFEQFEGRWHKDGTPIPDGTRSGAGDTDLTSYSLRKWARLAADGNPTVQLILFSPENKVYHQNRYGRMLREAANLFISKESGSRYLGYLRSQVQLMLGLRSGHTNRPELVETYGVDLKAGYHACRLGIQGIQLMREGYVSLPMRDCDREPLIALRRGEYGRDSQRWVLDYLAVLEDELKRSIDQSHLPDHPDRVLIDNFLANAHLEYWEEAQLV
nr:nucleotidyltransferase domain-containing protein [Mycolicibacterium sp. BK634]